MKLGATTDEQTRRFQSETHTTLLEILKWLEAITRKLNEQHPRDH
jgi:hypothetical protein